MAEYYYDDLGQDKAYLFHEGTYYRSYEFLGAHPISSDKGDGVRFVVWAPRAREVFVTGDFNFWDRSNLPLRRIGESGLWSICVIGVKEYQSYKYRIISYYGHELMKADPYAFHAETRPATASKYYDINDFPWSDGDWMAKRASLQGFDQPISIYEVNLMSWKRHPDNTQYSYLELAKSLVSYVKSMGYTHIELMPVMEHPHDGSWGYQQTGYYAPTSRFGNPKEFMHLINEAHKNNIGVILDWVPVHFCKDDHGLRRFDGTECYESSNQALAENEGWGTLNFDYTKGEVHSFLISNAMYWYDYYHIDGLRIDAVGYVLYLNSGGKDIRNIHGGIENIEGIEFLKKLNTILHQHYPGTLTMAEDSTSWPLVTKPVYAGGLGFDYKWNMGWMNDTLEYMEYDSIYRKHHQNNLTFGIMYCFSENFLLPLSHDEVVHLKKSLIGKLPGDYYQQFANLRLLYLYKYCYPGKKLLFMGGEFGQFAEWSEVRELDWSVLQFDKHQRLHTFVAELNKVYRNERSLHDIDNGYHRFNWIEHSNHQESVLIFERIGDSGEKLICAFNFTPVPREYYPIGVDKEGTYMTVINSDHQRYGGGLPRRKRHKAYEGWFHDRPYHIRVDIPPLGGIVLKVCEN